MILEGCDSPHSTLRDCTNTQIPLVFDSSCTHGQGVLPSALLRVGLALQCFRLSEGLPFWPKAMAFYPGIEALKSKSSSFSHLISPHPALGTAESALADSPPGFLDPYLLLLPPPRLPPLTPHHELSLPEFFLFLFL